MRPARTFCLASWLATGGAGKMWVHWGNVRVSREQMKIQSYLEICGVSQGMEGLGWKKSRPAGGHANIPRPYGQEEI